MPSQNFEVEVYERGRPAMMLSNVEVEQARIPGVGVAFHIRGVVTDEQMARPSMYERALGLPRDFVHVAQTGRRSPTAEDLAAIREAYLHEFDPEKIEIYKTLREKVDEVLTRDDTVIMED